jgi:hypothetical protein
MWTGQQGLRGGGIEGLKALGVAALYKCEDRCSVET